MSALGRRSILRGLAAAPVAAASVAEQMKLAGIGGTLGSVAGITPGPPSVSANEPVRYHTFASWLKKMAPQLKSEARYITALDPDLAARRLPLTTLVRLQRERNYERIIEERRRDIENRITLRGFIEWWA